ncbi:rhodanese-like domain-containing protein [Hymenobacter sp. B1770]|uniref:rhodanese-like domain-containing protein n=1 Tax=Hymenobacter sp. B1770 TaxID=1718788 RepID=UPI003CF22AF3
MFGLFQPTPPAHHNLTPAQFAEGLRRSGAVLVDVRRPDEYALGYIPGSVNIDVTAADFAQRVATLDKTTPTYVYCRSGARSAKAAAQLSAAGFTDVHNLLGGVLDWPTPLTS